MQHHSLLSGLRSLRQSRKAVRLVSSVAASLLTAGSIASLQPARADVTSLKKPLATLSSTVSLSTQRTMELIAPQPLAQVQPGKAFPVAQQMGMFDLFGPLMVGSIVVVGGLIFFSSITGLVIVSEQEVGVVVKKFGGRLPHPRRRATG